jgi:diphthine-ammonia ligase
VTEAFVSWSGGKDSCLACYRAIASGINVRYLLNMVTEEGQWSRSHGLSAELLRVQAEAMGISLVQKQTADSDYETEFKNALLAFKQEGITAGIFGDIDFNAHREWIERVCSAGGVTPVLPLWEQDQQEIFKDFINLGFESVVIATRADFLGEEWLGRKLNRRFIADLSKLGNITPCGEAGEYHTYVINGPLFHKRIQIMESSKERKNDHWFLRITRYTLKSKSKSLQG